MIKTDNRASFVEDFKAYLTYLATHPIKLTKTKGYFAKKDLLAIYPQMKCDIRDVEQHVSQLDYPILHLFYHLSIVLDFFKVIRTKSTASAIIQNEQIDAYMKMTATEQYLTLLEAFWVEADWDELQGGKWSKASSNIEFLIEELQDFPANYEIVLSKYEEIANSVDRYGQFFYYFTYFGFWRFTIDHERSIRPNQPFCTIAHSITLTPLFKSIYRELYESWDPYKGMKVNHDFEFLATLFNSNDEVEEEEEEEDEEIEPLSELLRPLFPKEEFTSILRKKQPVYEERTFIFQVMLSPSCWRTLQLSSAHTLLDLHDLIQEAFGFGDDHLYAFYMDGNTFSKSCYNSPMDSNGPYVNDVEIGRLELYQGQSFLYLFDFGVEWGFNVEVVKIIDEDEFFEPQILEAVGEAPEQY